MNDSFFKTIEKVDKDTDNNRYEYCDHFVCMIINPNHHDDDYDKAATTNDDYNDSNH